MAKGATGCFHMYDRGFLRRATAPNSQSKSLNLGASSRADAKRKEEDTKSFLDPFETILVLQAWWSGGARDGG